MPAGELLAISIVRWGGTVEIQGQKCKSLLLSWDLPTRKYSLLKLRSRDADTGEMCF
jgi:hypothetical protein